MTSVAWTRILAGKLGVVDVDLKAWGQGGAKSIRRPVGCHVSSIEEVLREEESDIQELF